MKLRTRLFQLVLGIVIPLIALAGVFGYLVIDQQKTTFRDAAIARNRALMTAVEAEIRGHVSTLQALAAAESLAADDLEGFYAAAIRVLDSQRDWFNVTLSLPNGVQVLNARRPLGSALSHNADMESTERVRTTLAPTAGGVVPDPYTGKFGVAVRVPVVRDGKLAYLLSATLNPDAFADLIRAQNLPSNWVSGLVDDRGHYIARVPPRSSTEMASEDYLRAVARTDEGWYRGLTKEGHDTFTAHKTSAFTGWSIGLAMPSAEVNAAAFNALWILGLGTVATLALALSIAYRMGRRIAVPISSLASAAHSLGRAASPLELEIQPGLDELEEVAQALKDASQAIQERQQLVEREQSALKAADRSKDEFLAMLGHELRNPLGAITASAEVLRVAKPGDSDALRAQGVIERQTKHITRLIEDLLDVSRVTMGKVTLRRERFDLAQLATRVVRTWEQSREDGATVSMTGDPASVWVEADRARMEQVLANLLGNAQKFSPAGRRVRVRVTREGEQAVLEVADEGEGIAPELLPRVFGLFVQGPHGPDRGRGGMGLGLALVQRITQMHGGTVEARSAGAGRGATFTVRLPVTTESDPAADQHDAPAPRVGKRRILIVEDNQDAREMMQTMLSLEGHSVRAVPDGRSGLAETARWQPDVVLVDIGLPDVDGYEVARQLRAADLHAVTLIAVTGYGQAEDERRAAAAGFDLHLTKPVSAERLRQVLGSL